MSLPSIFIRTLCALALLGRMAVAAADPRPAPDLANEHYGPHERNVLDLWKGKSEQPTPLVVYIHGGGFSAGSKDSVSPVIVQYFVGHGVAVMAINYRFSPEFHFPAHYMDAARAIQSARLHAKEWHLDPKRVAATGGSAGGAISLWLAFHDDLADPKRDDPVLRESTRLSAVAVTGGQSSLDPRVIREWAGVAAARHPAVPGFYGLMPDEFETPKAYKLYEAASPITYLTKDDPPVYGHYGEKGVIPPDARPGAGIHHLNFGLRLKEQMDKLGIECVIHDDTAGAKPQELVDFLMKHLAR